MTILIAGSASKISDKQVQRMAAVGDQLLAEIPPPTVTLGKVLYHPEAIAGTKLPWTPHITVAYSTTQQPTGPIVAALGPSLPERKVTFSTLSVVNQRGPERNWDWQPQATVRLGGPP